MPNFVINSADLVRQAYRFVGIANNNDDVTDSMQVEGISYLNQILAADQANGMNIPATKQFRFNLTPGQAFYEISRNSGADITDDPIMDVDNAVLLYSNLVQYPIMVVDATELTNVPLSINTQSWPSQMMIYKYQRIQAGTKTNPMPVLIYDPNSCVIRFYPMPSSAFPVILYAKGVLANIQKNQNIEIPPHMMMYLRYALAHELTMEYERSMWDDRHERKLQELKEMFTAGNEIDNRIAPSPTLGTNLFNRPMATNVPYY